MATETGENKYNRYGKPALDFIFTGTKKSLKDRSGNRQLQVTRDSVGTYVDENGVIQTAASGEARFDHDPETGESLGLLVEEARTNLVTYSEDFSGTGWTGATIVSTNVTSSPDGTSTADLVYPSSTGFYRARYIPITTSGTVTLSAYVKSAGWRYINLSMVATVAAVKFDLIDNAYNVVNSNYSNADIHSVGNGWFRIQAACDVATVNGDAFAITFSDDFAGGMYATTSGTSGIYIWGAQLEVGSFPTSYIPTSGSTVIRAADVASLTNSSIYDTDSFTILNEPFGVSAGSTSLSLVGPNIKRTTVYSTNLSQTNILNFKKKTDEFWQWRILGSSFGLPSFTTDGQVTVDWGDGTVETLTTSDHTFTDGDGYHDIGFRLDSGTYFRPYINNNASHVTKVVAVGPAPESMKFDGQRAFFACTNLEAFDAAVDLSGGTDLYRAWRSCTNLKSFPALDTSSIRFFDSTWTGCSSLTSFPLLNTATGTSFTEAWYNCTGLTSFPALDTSSGTNFDSAWYGCTSLTSFPLIDTSSGTNFIYAWYNCNSLTSFPLIDASSGTNFTYAWYNCSSLTSFPTIDMSSGTNFYRAWRNCVSLTSFGLINTASATSFNESWYNCNSLTSFPLINTSLATDLAFAWRSCNSLTSFPLIDTSSCTNFVETWRVCSSLTSFPSIDVSSGTSFYMTWRECYGLTAFPALNFIAAQNFYFCWNACSNLVDFPAGCWDNWNPTAISNNIFHEAFGGCSSLSATSVENILNSIDTSGQSAPASGVDITIDYNAGSGTPNITTAVTNLKSRGWTITLNGVAQ